MLGLIQVLESLAHLTVCSLVIILMSWNGRF